MANSSRWLNSFSWAIFLACSWTWCIGMFLPVLLVRDYGVGGWIVFAIPNVIGAAAMGWVVRSRAHSESIVEQHRAACIAFSLVTIAFQIYFAGWLLGLTSLLLIVPLALVQIGLDMDRLVAAGVWVASVVAFAVLSFAGGAFVSPELPPEFVAQPMFHLLYLAPVCAFGFLLCPYLDLTFHRARQSVDCATPFPGIPGEERGGGSSEISDWKSQIAENPRPAYRERGSEARVAFTMGFGAFFLVMILFTLAYAGLLAGAASGIGVRDTTLAREAIGVHMALQLIFTVAVHGRAVRQNLLKPQAAWPLLVGAVVFGVVLAITRQETFTLRPPSLPEVLYRAFMGFYGLFFPAYVWLCMIPSGASWTRAMIVFAVAVMIATPMFWLGFIEQKMLWLLPGVGVVLLSRMLLGNRRRQPRAADV